MAKKKKLKATNENRILDLEASLPINDYYKFAVPGEQACNTHVTVQIGKENHTPAVTEEVLKLLDMEETPVSSPKRIEKLLESVRNSNSEPVDDDTYTNCTFLMKKEGKKSSRTFKRIDKLMEDICKSDKVYGDNEPSNDDSFSKTGKLKKKKSISTAEAIKKPPALNSDAIAKKFKISYKVKVFGDVLYVFNGEYYVAENKLSVIRKIKLCLSDDERARVPYTFYEEAVKQLESDPLIVLDKRPDNSGCVLFENGMFNICTGVREMHTPPERFCIYKVHANYTWYKSETPVFDRFLDDITEGHKDIKVLILTFLGYCLIPDLDAKCFFVLGTAPNSGKSILIKLLERLIGEEVVSNSTLHGLDRQFGMANLIGKVLNTFGDLPGGMLKEKAVSCIKALTGDDKVPIEKKYKDEFSYQNMAKFVFATNKPIQIKEDDDAFWDRMVVIPFMVSVPKEKQNKKLLELLWEERDGIVYQAMYHARRLIKKNYVFPECWLSNKIKNDWRCLNAADVIDFVRLYCDLSDCNSDITTQKLYEAYVEYCRSYGLNEKRVEDFSHALRKNYDLALIRIKENNHYLRGYRGIRLKQNGGDNND